jgi:hypothetical protein
MKSPLPFSVLRPSAWASLTRALDGTLARDAALSAARDVLLRPLELLELMAADAPAALGDDALKAERLRMILHLASPFASLVREARELDSGEAEAAAKGFAGPSAAGAYEPGLVDHGALVLVALAAVRVAPPGLGPLFLRTVHGLALSAAPAEALARLEPAQPSERALAVVLNTLYLLDAVGSALKNPFLRPFAGDPAERGRWASLSRLLEHPVFHDVIQSAASWDGAFAAGLELVSPGDAWPGDTVTFDGDLGHLSAGAKLRAGTTVVFASAEGAPLPARSVRWRRGGGAPALQVEVPERAQPGWVGFSDDERLAAANLFRWRLAERLSRTLGADPCLRGTRLPLEALRAIGAPDPRRDGHALAVPPRTAGNRFAGGLPHLTHAALSPAPAASGTELTLAWESAGADHVRLQPGGLLLAPAGQRGVLAPAHDAELCLELTPVRRRGDAFVAGPSRTLRAVGRPAPRVSVDVDAPRATAEEP